MLGTANLPSATSSSVSGHSREQPSSLRQLDDVRTTPTSAVSTSSTSISANDHYLQTTLQASLEALKTVRDLQSSLQERQDEFEERHASTVAALENRLAAVEGGAAGMLHSKTNGVSLQESNGLEHRQASLAERVTALEQRAQEKEQEAAAKKEPVRRGGRPRPRERAGHEDRRNERTRLEDGVGEHDPSRQGSAPSVTGMEHAGDQEDALPGLSREAEHTTRSMTGGMPRTADGAPESPIVYKYTVSGAAPKKTDDSQSGTKITAPRSSGDDFNFDILNPTASSSHSQPQLSTAPAAAQASTSDTSAAMKPFQPSHAASASMSSYLLDLADLGDLSEAAVNHLAKDDARTITGDAQSDIGAHSASKQQQQHVHPSSASQRSADSPLPFETSWRSPTRPPDQQISMTSVRDVELAKREAAILRRELELEAEAQRLLLVERDLLAREAEFDDHEDELEERLRAVQKREADVQRREAEQRQAEGMREWRRGTGSQEAREAELYRRRDELRFLKSDMVQRTEDLARAEQEWCEKTGRPYVPKFTMPEYRGI